MVKNNFRLSCSGIDHDGNGGDVSKRGCFLFGDVIRQFLQVGQVPQGCVRLEGGKGSVAVSFDRQRLCRDEAQLSQKFHVVALLRKLHGFDKAPQGFHTVPCFSGIFSIPWPGAADIGAVHQFERMAGTLVQECGVPQEMRIGAVALHLFLQNGIQIDGIIQGIETGKSLVVKKQICSAVLVVIFMELFQGLFRRFLEQPFAQKLFKVFNSLLPLLRGNRGIFTLRKGMLLRRGGCVRRGRHSGGQQSCRQKKSGKESVHSARLLPSKIFGKLQVGCGKREIVLTLSTRPGVREGVFHDQTFFPFRHACCRLLQPSR